MRRRILILTGTGETGHQVKAALSGASSVVTLMQDATGASARLSGNRFDLALVEENLSGITGMDFIEVEKQKHPSVDFVLLAGNPSIDGAIEAVTRGALHYLPLPVDGEALKTVTGRIFSRREMSDEMTLMKGRLHERYGIDTIVSCSPSMEDVFRKIRAVARTESTVLIHGETGVGKELVANAIHLASNRPDGRFVAINCGALPDTLLESELFGHEKGAFTGADRMKPGRFELASEGTVFLDEIATMSKSMQVKLLRVLQEKKIERVGGSETFPVDVRVIAATNLDLKEMVKNGDFREDLYYRLNVFPIIIPPLRERPEDIPVLAAHFLKKYRQNMKKNITDISRAVLGAFAGYDWPGNVRELENLVERAVIMEETDTLTPESIPLEIMAIEPALGDYEDTMSMEDARRHVIEKFEKEYLSRLLTKYRGRINEVARHAGLSSRSIHMKMSAYGFHKEDFKK